MDWCNKYCNILPIVTISGVTMPQEINPSYSGDRWSGHVTCIVVCIVCKTILSNILQVRYSNIPTMFLNYACIMYMKQYERTISKCTFNI